MKTIRSQNCPQCGTPLPHDALDGLCPRCLIGLNLLSQTAFTDPDAQGAGTPPAAPLPPEDIARHFPQLEILDCLGRGGMGVVYKARQKTLNRIVALKLLAPERVREPAFAERFAREAQALAKLNHPNIVTLYEFGQTDGLFYFIMEFVDGLNLRQLLHAGRIAPREALAIVPQICDALQYAHDAGIVHRDIKPENILLDRQGHVKVADFGLAKLTGQADALPPGTASSFGIRHSTIGNPVMGTPQYMAPEQTEHPSEVDHRADIYSLGVVFYQMLTGELPAGKTFQPPSSRMRGIVVDVRLDEVVLRALEKEPERRYQQASILKTRVETILTTPPQTGSRRDWRTRVAVVGVRDGKRVINWPAVVLDAVALTAVFALVTLLGTANSDHPFHPLPFLLVWLGILSAIPVAIYLGLTRQPIGRLTSLDAPPSPPEGQAAGTTWQSPTSGWGWLIGKVFGSTFTSPLAYKCANLSALAFLSFLGFMPLPGWNRCFGFSGFSGLIGLAFIVEMIARSKSGHPDPSLRYIFLVGRRNGKAVIHWSGVLLSFLLALAIAEAAAIVISLILEDRINTTAVLLALWGATIVTGIRIRRGRTMPVEQLMPLDEPHDGAVGAGRPQPATGGASSPQEARSPSAKWSWKKRMWAAGAALLLLCAGGGILWAQRPQKQGEFVEQESPDNHYTASVGTWHAMRIFGGDRLTYRFTVQGLGGSVSERWEIPVPSAKLATNYLAQSVSDLTFDKHGHIEWLADSSSVKFLVRDIEVARYDVPKPAAGAVPATTAASGSGPEVVRVPEPGGFLFAGALLLILALVAGLIILVVIVVSLAWRAANKPVGGNAQAPANGGPSRPKTMEPGAIAGAVPANITSPAPSATSGLQAQAPRTGGWWRVALSAAAQIAAALPLLMFGIFIMPKFQQLLWHWGASLPYVTALAWSLVSFALRLEWLAFLMPVLMSWAIHRWGGRRWLWRWTIGVVAILFALSVFAVAAVVIPVTMTAPVGIHREPKSTGTPPPAPVANVPALKEFGVSRTGPIETGYVFFEGKYIDAPYVVERRGLDTYINDCRVRRAQAWPRPVPDPGDPPAGAKTEDPYWNNKWRWLCANHDFPKAVDLMAEAYRKSGTFSLVNVKADSRTADILLMPSGSNASTTKTFLPDSPLPDAEHDKAFFVQRLGPDSVLMIQTGGASEILMGADKGLQFLRVIASDKSPGEKQQELEAAGLAKGPEMARQFAAITASPQLARRLAEGTQAPKPPPERPAPRRKIATIKPNKEGPQSLLALPADAAPIQKQVNELLLQLVHAKFTDPTAETALFALGEPAVRELFRLAMLKTGNYDLLENIRTLLAKFPSNQAREIVEAELLATRELPSPDSPEECARHHERFSLATRILHARRDRASVPTILKMLDAVASYDERSDLIMALGEIGDPSAAPAIRRYLDDKEDMVRSSATSALVKLNAIEMTPELRQRYGPRKPPPPAPPTKPLVLPFAADAMTGVTITIGKPFTFTLTVPPDRLPEFFQAMSGAASSSLPTEKFHGEGWGWPGTDPLIKVTLKDGSKLEIMMAVAGKPPFCPRGDPPNYFDSPKLVALVKEVIHDGLVADLADPDFARKFKAAAALFDRGDAVGEGVLVEALQADKPLTVRAGAAIRLMKKHPQAALKTAGDLAAADVSGPDGQALVQAVAVSTPVQAVPLLKKFWLEGKFPLHERCAIQALGRIASPEAIGTLIDVWGSGSEFKMQLVYAAGRCFEPEEKAEAVAWWQKNKSRPRMELLADGYVTDTGGHGYGQYPLEEMQKLDRAGAVRELMRRLPAAGGDELERIAKGLQKLTGVALGNDKDRWLQWWQSHPEATAAPGRPPTQELN